METEALRLLELFAKTVSDGIATVLAFANTPVPMPWDVTIELWKVAAVAHPILGIAFTFYWTRLFCTRFMPRTATEKRWRGIGVLAGWLTFASAIILTLPFIAVLFLAGSRRIIRFIAARLSTMKRMRQLAVALRSAHDHTIGASARFAARALHWTVRCIAQGLEKISDLVYRQNSEKETVKDST